MGLVSGSSENAQVVEDLLCGLIDGSLSTAQLYLFALDGSKALHSAIKEPLASAATPTPISMRRVSDALAWLKVNAPRTMACMCSPIAPASIHVP